MPRWVIPVLLGAIAAGSVLALQAPGEPRPTAQPPAASAAPVLSARRVPALLAGSVAEQRLRRALDPLLGGRASSCLVVRHGERTLYEQRASVSLVPASNMKVLTAAAVLERLSPSTRFATEVRAAAAPVAGVLAGPVWLVGGGDPLLETADYEATFVFTPHVRTKIEDLAEEVVQAGVVRITGAVLGDESRYDTQRYVPSWRSRYITEGDAGPASALMVNDGFTEFRPLPVPSPAPAVHAASVLIALLRARGVTVEGEAGAGQAPKESKLVATLPSLPVGEIVGEMLRDSDNTTAELLVKELGVRASGEGSWSAGLRAVRDTLEDADLPLEGLAAVDGSGLDRSDRATCALLIEAVTDAGPASALAKGFPVAGQTGTLTKRFVGHPAAGRLRAKTGSLEGVVALTGFLDVPQGHPLAFAFLSNDVSSEPAGRALQERLGAVLATYPDAPPLESLGPAAPPVAPPRR